MADITVEATCEEGYTVMTVTDGDWELAVDALSEEGPSANQVLAADYCSCYIPAFRVAADEHGHDDVGRIEADVEADLDDDDDLTRIDWTLRVETDLGEDADAIVERGEEICHVHAALREGLHADITVEDGAF
jgi:organic hydroperoxide reductase OsmC/OhrA